MTNQGIMQPVYLTAASILLILQDTIFRDYEEKSHRFSGILILDRDRQLLFLSFVKPKISMNSENGHSLGVSCSFSSGKSGAYQKPDIGYLT